MAKESLINCPACGFSIKASSKSCDFCGYEFESFATATSQPSAREPETPSQGRGQSKSTRNGSKKGSNGSRKSASKSQRKPNGSRNGNTRLSRTQETSVQEETAVESPSEAEGPETDADPQTRIKELEKQLSDAEKELDVISKLLGQGKEKQPEAHAAAAAVQTQDAVVVRPSARPQQAAAEVVPRALSSIASPVPAPSATALSGEGSSSGGGLSFKIRGMTMGSIVIGLVVYAISFLLSANIGQLEMYMLIIPASILVGLGLYASLEATPASKSI